MGAAQTSTGEPTLATVGNAPQKPAVVTNTYHTTRGLMTLDKIKEQLASNAMHLSHLGDDALKALNMKAATEHAEPVVPFTDPNAPKESTSAGVQKTSWPPANVNKL